jgi:ABC-type sugar transport system permease subunit
VRRRTGREALIAALFLVPLFVMYGVYFVYSFWFLIRTSFEKVDLSFAGAVNVGWHNYQLVYDDPEFRRAVLDNLVFAASTIVIGLTIAFGIAVMLASRPRGRRAYFTIFLVPALTPVALVATIFGQMLEYQLGSLNTTLRAVGLGFLAQHWLTQPGWAYGAVIGLFAYLIGLPIMYYTADLAAINTSAIEAALLDGAGPWRLMRSVLHPMMRATHVTVVLSLLLGSFRAFEIVLLSTGGGPGDSTQIVGTYTYSFFTSGGQTIGLASAASVLILIIALLISVVQNIVLTRDERHIARERRRHRRAQRRKARADARGAPPGDADGTVLAAQTARPAAHSGSTQ